jgi:hypothetical protein
MLSVYFSIINCLKLGKHSKQKTHIRLKYRRSKKFKRLVKRGWNLNIFFLHKSYFIEFIPVVNCIKYSFF